MDKDLQQVWDKLADSWTNLRVRPWEEVLEFSKSIDRGFVIDIGCGNCRNLVPFIKNNVDCIGIDFSKGMIKQAKLFLKRRELKTNLVIGEFTNIPFKSESIPTIICNAVLHDVYLKEDRTDSLKEMERISKNNCKILLSVWNRYQKRFILPLIRSFFSGHYADIWVNWNYHGKIYKRFYHLYTQNELKKAVESVGLKVKKLWNDNRNIWILVNKCKK